MKRIGFWRQTEDEDSELPWPGDFVDPNWDHDDKMRVVKLLESGKIVQRWRGPSMCRLCGCFNGSADMQYGDKFYYSTGLSHYVKQHNVRLPEFNEL